VISKYCHVFAFEIERLQATAIKGTDKKKHRKFKFSKYHKCPESDLVEV
jgi:hypothetical protein